jgi:thiopeptide-type bacteriocin biosynthesis protein
LYLKLYAGESVIDPLLTETLAEPLQRLQTDGRFDHWFFIRYGDPDWHLRLRLHGDPDALHCQALRALSDLADGLIADGLVSRLVVDSYDRELERYGGAYGIEAAEQLF